MTRKKVLILFGGRSSEYEVSLVSVYALLSNINKDKYDITTIGITKTGDWYLYTGDYESIKDNGWCREPYIKSVSVCPDYSRGCLYFGSAPEETVSYRPDLVFPMIHGKYGEDGRITGMFSMMDIPVVGCPASSAASCMDKAMTKSIVNQAGIRQAKCVIARRSDRKSSDDIMSECEASLGYPMFVKPCRAGSSVGITKVHGPGEFRPALELAFGEDDKIIIEETITGKETEVAVLEENGKYTVSVPAEIDVGTSEFYDYDTKYVSDVSSFYIPARIPEEKHREAAELAERIFRCLGCRGLSRVDFFYTPDGEFIFNEINTMPGFTPISMYPKLMDHEGIKYPDLIDRLIESACVDN